MNTTTPFIVILVTVPSNEVGRQIAAALLEGRLAACVNITAPLRSLYTWEGTIHDDEELLLIVKTRAELFERAAAAVRAAHPYQVPEIIALPIAAGSETYLKWIEDVTSEL